MAQVVSTCGKRIRGILHHSMGKASPGFLEGRALNLARGRNEQIRFPHVLKNMGTSSLSLERIALCFLRPPFRLTELLAMWSGH